MAKNENKNLKPFQDYGDRHLSLADFVILSAVVAAETGVDFHNKNSTREVLKKII